MIVGVPWPTSPSTPAGNLSIMFNLITAVCQYPLLPVISYHLQGPQLVFPPRTPPIPPLRHCHEHLPFFDWSIITFRKSIDSATVLHTHMRKLLSCCATAICVIYSIRKQKIKVIKLCLMLNTFSTMTCPRDCQWTFQYAGFTISLRSRCRRNGMLMKISAGLNVLRRIKVLRVAQQTLQRELTIP